MSRLSRLWRGELPLAEAFWGWAVLGGLLVNLSTSIAFLALLSGGQTALAFAVGYLPTLPYNLAAAVGVWRAADRHAGDPRLAQAARIAVVVWMMLLTLT
ncbi:MAG: hypothetical protein RMK64_10235 [Rhodovarius sp.]|nr:hypothetical protein [Rhodovarius sp.]MDW8315337.1 hypothetical protein [Rhodovarius sp.]